MKKYDLQNIKGILLFGPPGTGKTMLMKAVANEVEGVSLITISGSDIAKGNLELTLAAIKGAFNRARENSPAIIFMDELDALLPDRDHATEYTIHITSEFLQQIDGLKSSGRIIFVGATNRPDILDQAVLRPGRIDKFIYVPPPSVISRMGIFKEYLAKAPHDADIDYNKMAEDTEGYTGADIANICRQAKIEALEKDLSTSEESKIDMQLMSGIIENMKPSAPPSVLSKYMSFISIYGDR